MNIDDLQDKKIAIWGAGQEGQAVLTVLQKKISHADMTLLNDSVISDLVRRNLQQIKPDISIITGDAVKDSLRKFDVVIKSPGISIYRPEVIEAKQSGVVFTSSTQLWFEAHKNEKIIGVTGSKGKSTTTSMIAHMLSHLGYQVTLAGNIGTPLISMVDQKSDFWVLEMSSYQTSDFQGSVSTALLLNLYPEHLDWHQSVENYFRDKWHLLEQVKPGFAVMNHLTEKTLRSMGFISKNAQYFDHPDGIHVQNQGIYDGAVFIKNIQEFSLTGSHNLSNLCAALTVLKTLNLDINLEKAMNTLKDFKPLPHRLTVLGEKIGVLYVDDSISTIPQASIAAMEAFKDRPITILLGGYDRGVDINELVQYLVSHPIYAVITMPDSGIRIAEMLRQQKEIATLKLFEVNDLKQAVKKAKAITPKGGVVLLSPAAPSYHAFKNFKERGNQFALLIDILSTRQKI